jgi:predicted O-methyltransferase YrrM
MTQEQWTQVDRFISGQLIPPDPVLDAVLQANADGGLPGIDVTPNQGKLLEILARMQQAADILELGTLGGYSTIWLARAVPAGGRVVTLEANPMHADIARANLMRAGVADRVDIRLGKALETLPRLAEEKQGPFDFVFIDADRTNLTEYFDWAVKLAHSGSVIIVDNVVRKGGVIDASSEDANIKGVRRFAERLSSDSRVTATMVQTVSAKGYDGFAMALVI